MVTSHASNWTNLQNIAQLFIIHFLIDIKAKCVTQYFVPNIVKRLSGESSDQSFRVVFPLQSRRSTWITAKEDYGRHNSARTGLRLHSRDKIRYDKERWEQTSGFTSQHLSLTFFFVLLKITHGFDKVNNSMSLCTRRTTVVVG